MAQQPRKKMTDLWHVGIAHAPIASFLTPSPPPAITWLPMPRSFAFIADPFGLCDEAGNITLFVEALDYRNKIGEIHYYRFDAAFRLLETGCALKTTTHLSYPFIVPHQGEVYMLPEAHRSGKLTLYRATHFPNAWQPVKTLLELPAIDASVIAFEGRWWMFFALAGEGNRAVNELHIAYADDLMGEWVMHAQNPVRCGIESSRMGGTPFILENALHLPVQDCTHTYGGSLKILRVDMLTPTAFSAHIVQDILPERFSHTYQDGCHTLSACGSLTLVDVKHLSPSPLRRVIDWQRRFRRLLKG